MEQMPRHRFGEVCVQEEVLALKNVLGYWLTRRDGEIGGRENGRDRGHQESVGWASTRERVRSGSEGQGGTLASGCRRPASFLRLRVETDASCRGSSEAASRSRRFVSVWPCCQAREQWGGHEGPLS